MRLMLVLTASILAQAPAPAPPPDTDIFLAPLTRDGPALSVGSPVNITSSPGYDNQPFFTPDGRQVLFTSIRGGATQTDIYAYDLTGKNTVRLTATAEGEYSPTV